MFTLGHIVHLQNEYNSDFHTHLPIKLYRVCFDYTRCRNILLNALFISYQLSICFSRSHQVSSFMSLTRPEVITPVILTFNEHLRVKCPAVKFASHSLKFYIISSPI